MTNRNIESNMYDTIKDHRLSTYQIDLEAETNLFISNYRTWYRIKHGIKPTKGYVLDDLIRIGITYKKRKYDFDFLNLNH